MPGEEFHQLTPDESNPTDPLETQQPYSPGNRPASGARRATPGEVLSRGFQGSQTAGDFLGLDLEFAASQDLPSAGLDIQNAPELPQPVLGPSDIGPSDLPAEEILQSGADAGLGGGPTSFEYGEDLGSDELTLEPAPKKSPLKTLVAMLAVGGVIALGVLYGPGLYARFAPKKDEVARAPRDPASRTKDPAVRPEATVSGTTPEGASADPEAAPSDEPVALTSGEPSDPIEPLSGPELEPTTEVSADPDPLVAVSDPEPTVDIVGTLLNGLTGTSGAQPEGMASFPDLGSADYEWASEDQLELIWRGTEVPMEAVFAPARTIMPRVGAVRVFTNTGDVFEGRLYAVGQEHVWIDAAPGRIGLDGNRVERIERLVLEASANGEPVSVSTGKRVRVRVPGGLLFGRVLKAEGEEVTLALDDGGRVRVKSNAVEDLGSGRAVVVHR